MAVLDEVLGLLALAGYILAIVGLAAGITYVVIRIFPTERSPKKEDGAAGEPAKETKASGKPEDTPGGTLFRRSKRRGN
jgi:hypothetical protein